MAYAEPIPGQHPNATDHEKVAQASEILERLGRGESTRHIASVMGINRSTLYARLELINQPLPITQTVRRVHFERLETMIEGLQDRLDGEISNTDYGRLVAEQRQVLARQSALLRVEEAPTVDPGALDEIEAPDWEVGE